jgi:para-aminobenzoate synthetase component 1
MQTEIAPIKTLQIPCRPHYKKVNAPVNLDGLNQVFSTLDSPIILGSSTAKQSADGFSYWMAQPKEVFQFQSGQTGPFGKLNRLLNKYKLNGDFPASLSKGIFIGGWAGFFSYELGHYIESLPCRAIDDLKLPLIHLCFYDRLIAFDHKNKNFLLIALQLPSDTESPQQKLASLEKLFEKSIDYKISYPVFADIESVDFSKIHSNMSRDYYLQALKEIKRSIYDGNVYQINFSQRFDCDFHSRPIDLFHWQNFYNPSGYSAFLDCGNFQIVSASPEMFITISDGLISTKPIKGTRPRILEKKDQQRQINQKNFDELVASEKEQAELNMIIDLERNDIAKICIPGTRQVTQPRTIESYPTVFHAVATVSGRLKDDISFCDILRAMFPGGSITGAPKISAMNIISRLEPLQRAVYTGSIGFLGIEGSACLNIAIRTIIIKDRKAFVQTGGGIVADSEPDAEWNETIVKARALIAGVNSANKAYSG